MVLQSPIKCPRENAGIRAAPLALRDVCVIVSQPCRAGLMFGYRPYGPGPIRGLFSSSHTALPSWADVWRLPYGPRDLLFYLFGFSRRD
jgi:hypothetical protein